MSEQLCSVRLRDEPARTAPLLGVGPAVDARNVFASDRRDGIEAAEGKDHVMGRVELAKLHARIFAIFATFRQGKIANFAIDSRERFAMIAL